MITDDTVYARVNATWPRPLPALTFDEAKRAAKALFAVAGVPWVSDDEVVETSEPFGTGVRCGRLEINVDRGWPSLVHQLSHCFHRRLNPTAPGHSEQHAQLEQRLVEHVVQCGWLNSALRPKSEREEVRDA